MRPSTGTGTEGEAEGRLRLDKWLWYARFFRTRGAAARCCEAGLVRLGGRPVMRANQTIRPGDVLTFSAGGHVRAVRVTALGDHRGPAPMARLLYEDLAPPSPETALPR